MLFIPRPTYICRSALVAEGGFPTTVLQTCQCKYLVYIQGRIDALCCGQPEQNGQKTAKYDQTWPTMAIFVSLNGQNYPRNTKMAKNEQKWPKKHKNGKSAVY